MDGKSKMAVNKVNKKSFSERLKEVMQEKNISSAMLAEKTGMSVSAIYRMTNGDRGKNMEKLPKMARALGVSIDALFPEMDAPQEAAALQRAEPTTDDDDRGDLE